ncbi:MAG: class I SAM-dependent methyltransferase [bacterium]|nr:MAG: class I SAM-dependent methyltransferase [bacterium]
MYDRNSEIPWCRICGADQKFQRIRAHTVYGGQEEHNFWHCSECDAVYLFPIPSEEEEAQFYNQEFEKFMAKRSGKNQDWTEPLAHVKANQDQVKRRWPFLEPHLRSGQTLLEIGCSSGFMLNAFRDHGLNCVGIEPSGAFLDFLLANDYEGYKSLEELVQREEKKFNIIVHFFVLEHISDPYSFFSYSLELLEEGGKIIAEVPCVNDPLTSLYSIPAFEEFYWSIAHHYYYSQKSLGYILNKLGVKYEMLPEQRYDLSNHIVWMTEGKPGGQDRYNYVFSKELIEKYKQDLKDNWLCDTIFLYVYK